MIEEFRQEVIKVAALYPEKTEREIDEIAADIVKRRNPEHYSINS